MFDCAKPCLSSHASKCTIRMLSFIANHSLASCCEICCVPNVTDSSCKSCASCPDALAQASLHTLSHLVIASCHTLQVPVTLTQVHTPMFVCRPQMHCLKNHCTYCHPILLLQVAIQCKCQWPPRWSLLEYAFLKSYC